jgi:hypothetical protein
VNSLNLYCNNVQNITSGNRKDFSFPVNNCTTIVFINYASTTLYINNVLVFFGSAGLYTFTLGKKGLYKFNTEINLAPSARGSVVSYTQTVKSDKMLQIDQGNINNATINLNVTGAIKIHLIHDTNGDLFLNGINISPAIGPGTLVLDIGNDIDIINDTLIIQNVGSQTGYIIERLI